MENRTQKWWSGALMSLMLLAAGCSAKPVIEELPSTQAQETDMHIESTAAERDTSSAEETQETTTETETVAAEKTYYEIGLKAVPLEKERIASAIFADQSYEVEDVYGVEQYFVGDEQAIDFYDYTFEYYRVPASSAYNALLADAYAPLMLQDMRLERLFPEEELPGGTRAEAAQICGGILEQIGYTYTEQSIYTLDSAYAEQIGLHYSPSNGRQEDAVWEADDGAYLLIYRNGALLDVEEELAYVSPQSVCWMIYSPKYGLCSIHMEPRYEEVSRTEVEVITEEEAQAMTAELFWVNGIAQEYVEVTGYELVYCENNWAEDDLQETSCAIPCWKVSFREKEEISRLWENEGLIPRAAAISEGYLLLDARVGGSVYTFCPQPF